MERAFAVADDILRQGVVGISDIIVKPGLINVDFADVRSIMSGAGTALMGIGIGSGKTAAEDAAAAAISSPLLDSTIENAKGVVFNISGGPNLSLNEVNQADANVIFGALVDETLEDNISITVLATGFIEKGRDEEMSYAKEKRVPQSSSKDVSDPRRTSQLKRKEDVVVEPIRAPAPVAAPAPRNDDNDNIPDFLKNLKRRR
jgi:cell division protein FtsZ